MVHSLMDSILNPLNPNPWRPSPLFRRVLDEIHKPNPNFSDLILQYYQQMQSRVDPSFESIWIYTALTFRSRNHPKGDILDRIAAAKDLFDLISSCSAACGGAKSVALLAPVVALVENVVSEMGSVLKTKKEIKAMREVKNFVKVMLGFIDVCCSKNDPDPLVDSDPGWSYVGLCGVWSDVYPNVGEMFCGVNRKAKCELISEKDGDVRCLAGVVIAELFILRLCLNFSHSHLRKETETELKTWVVGSLTVFHNVYCFDVLMRVLLDKAFVDKVFLTEDCVLVRNVLYDALILVEYSFLDPENASHMSAEDLKLIAMQRLVFVHEAVEYFRNRGDQRRSISYTTAFSSSRLYSQIVKWIKSLIPVEDSSVISKGTSPKAVIEWLLNL